MAVNESLAVDDFADGFEFKIAAHGRNILA